jgi:hypothetical protein
MVERAFADITPACATVWPVGTSNSVTINSVLAQLGLNRVGRINLPEAIGTNKLPERQINGSSHTECSLSRVRRGVGGGLGCVLTHPFPCPQVGEENSRANMNYTM